MVDKKPVTRLRKNNDYVRPKQKEKTQGTKNFLWKETRKITGRLFHVHLSTLQVTIYTCH